MEKLPQTLINVPVAEREAIAGATEVWEAVEREAADLGDRGRVLVRPSGTEPLVRVMVEAPAQDEADAIASVLRTGRARIGLVRPPTVGAGAPPRRPPSTLYPVGMCGIVGYVGRRPCRDLLVAGLEKLEYRGYDSAGISLLEGDRVETVRAVGNLANLRSAVEERVGEGGVAVADPPATTGLAHTRWATHGRVTEENAHPHSDCSDRVHIVLNGIVENHDELRPRLESEGHPFSSETDAEIVAHLIERHYDGDLTEAVRASAADLRGHYAFVAMHADEPELLVGARKECPLVVGLGDDEAFLASAIPAFLAETRRTFFIERARS